MDGDGRDDVLIGASVCNDAYVALGPLSGEVDLDSTAALTIRGEGGDHVDIGTDINGDGQVNNFDIDPFVALLTGG